MEVELGEGDYKHCLPGTEVQIATCSRCFQRLFWIGTQNAYQQHNWWNHPSNHSVEAHVHTQRSAQCHQQEWHRWFEPQCLCWSGQINVKEQMHILLKFQHTQLVKQNWHKIQKLETGSHTGALHITFSCPSNQLLMRDYKENWPYVQKLSVSLKIQRVPPRSQGIESLSDSNGQTQVITQNMKNWIHIQEADNSR